MFPDFLPKSVNQLQDANYISLTQQIRLIAIATPLHTHSIKTAYFRQGTNNPPILLLHGFDSSVLEFARLIPLLAHHHQTWAVDLLGFGFTHRVPKINYNPATVKTHLYYFWKTAIAKPVILVGASTGGATAIDFTLAHPEAVEKLILIDSVGFNGGFALGQWLISPLDLIGVEIWKARKQLAFNLAKKTSLIDRTTLDAIRCALLPSEMPLWTESMMSFTRSGGYLHLKEKIPHLKKPTLILWGDNDQELGTSDAHQFKSAISNSKLVWILNAGHQPHWEQPQRVAQEIIDFAILLKE